MTRATLIVVALGLVGCSAAGSPELFGPSDATGGQAGSGVLATGGATQVQTTGGASSAGQPGAATGGFAGQPELVTGGSAGEPPIGAAGSAGSAGAAGAPAEACDPFGPCVDDCSLCVDPSSCDSWATYGVEPGTCLYIHGDFAAKLAGFCASLSNTYQSCGIITRAANQTDTYFVSLKAKPGYKYTVERFDLVAGACPKTCPSP